MKQWQNEKAQALILVHESIGSQFIESTLSEKELIDSKVRELETTRAIDVVNTSVAMEASLKLKEISTFNVKACVAKSELLPSINPCFHPSADPVLDNQPPVEYLLLPVALGVPGCTAEENVAKDDDIGINTFSNLIKLRPTCPFSSAAR